MSKTTSALLMVGLAAAGLASGYVFNNWQHEQKLSETKVATSDGAVVSSNVRPFFRLKDLEDKVRDVKEWDGQVLMINFWATWCPPCRKEIPAFIDLQEAYQDKGLVIIGVAIDTKDNVVDFVDPMGINYPVLIGNEEGISLAKAYGNRYGVLPYTVFVDRSGTIVQSHRNELTFQQAEAIIKPLL